MDALIAMDRARRITVLTVVIVSLLSLAYASTPWHHRDDGLLSFIAVVVVVAAAGVLSSVLSLRQRR